MPGQREWGASSVMICLDASAGPILVAGGGRVGIRKIRTLLEAGMAVDLVSPEALPELRSLASEGRIAWMQRPVERADFECHSFAILALPAKETEEAVLLARGTACSMDCCAAPGLGTWSLAAQFRAGGYLVGTATGGKSPAAAARLRDRIREFLEGEHLSPLQKENTE